MNMKKRGIDTRQLTAMAMMAAIAYVVVFICHFIMPPIVEQPPLKLDLKDTVIVMAGFLMGPLASFCISVVVSFIEMITISGTGVVGFIMNVLGTCAFACTASFIYKKMHTKNGAVVGLLVGAAAMVVTMILWNYIITPWYQGVPRAIVAKMLIPTFLPFNAIKSGINVALTLLIYKPLATALRKSRFLLLTSENTPKTQTDTWSDKAAEHFDAPAGKQKLSVGIYLFGAALLVTCVLFALALAKVI